MLPIGDTIPRRNPPIVVWSLILVNTFVFLFELGLPPSVLERFFYMFGIVPARYSHPEWAILMGLPLNDYWPFLTSMFLHGGWLHILANMWTLWIFGDNVEDRMGPWRFLCFYLLCGVAGGVVHWLANPESIIPTIGASGAIAGVLGGYFFLFPFARIIVVFPILFLPVFLEFPAVTYAVLWALTQLFSGVLALTIPDDVGGIAWWGHIGGFTAGVLLHFLFIRRGKSYRRLARDEYGIDSAWVPNHYWRKYQ